MKNWKYIEGAKVGNSLGTDIYQHKLDPNQYMVVDWDKDTVTIIVNGHVRDVIKNLNNLAYALHLYKKVNVMNTKTGNDTLVQYVTSKPKAVNEDKTGAEEFFKQLSDDVKEREKKDDAEIKLVGNAREWEVKDSDVIEYINGDPNATAIQRICIKHLGTPDTSKVQALLVDEKSNKWAVVKRGTSAKMKVGNANLETSVEKGKLGLWNWYVHKDGTIVSGGTSSTETNAKEMARKALEKEKAGNKVGNRVIEKESEMSQELKNLLKKAPEWIKEKIQYAFSHGFTIDEKDFINAIKKEVGNASVGNAKDKNGKELRIGDIVLVWTSAGERAGKVKAISGDRITVAIRNEGDWSTPGKLADKVSNSKAKNQASDDKFAYVMREFDEGKLKTPDGKVVTDPAQAKAIAYSESKKTENGLARARNAMNKRCGNSQVTLWKGNDSVLISEDGTVQYLESNSFETDRDKYGSMQEAIDDLTKKGYRKK